ncbi:hypothetical protein [Pedococcus ginsenosidimutans]
MDWVEFAKVVAAPVSGLAGVYIGGVLQGRKDQERWEREVERENQRWQREDRARWLAEQHRLYSALMTVLQAQLSRTRWGYASDLLLGVGPDDESNAMARKEAEQLGNEADKAVEAIGILGAKAIHREAQYVSQCLVMAGVMGNARRRDDSDAYAEQVRDYFGKADDGLQKLRAMVRHELGVVDDAPADPAS